MDDVPGQCDPSGNGSILLIMDYEHPNKSFQKIDMSNEAIPILIKDDDFELDVSSFEANILICKINGRRPSLVELEKFIDSNWSTSTFIILLLNCFFVVSFGEVKDRDYI